MTEDHDFKAVVRARMGRTGESYAAARAQLRSGGTEVAERTDGPHGQFDPKAFARDGYVVVRGLAGRTLVRVATDAINRELAARPAREGTNSRSLSAHAEPGLFAALQRSPMWGLLDELVAPGRLEVLGDEAQLIVHPAPSNVANPTPHIDGHGPNFEAPRSFSLIVGILMSDQTDTEMGNVLVWPGTHLLYSEYLQSYGPTSLLEHAGRIRRAAPNVALPRPTTIRGRTGDVYIAHPLLGHETGANFNGPTRKAIYLRLRRHDHTDRWEQCLVDPLLEYNVRQ